VNYLVFVCWSAVSTPGGINLAGTESKVLSPGLIQFLFKNDDRILNFRRRYLKFYSEINLSLVCLKIVTTIPVIFSIINLNLFRISESSFGRQVGNILVNCIVVLL